MVGDVSKQVPGIWSQRRHQEFWPSSITDHLNELGTSLCFCESQISVIKCSRSARSQALFQALGIPRGTRLVPCAGDCCGGTPPQIGRQTKNCPVRYNAVGLGSEVKGGLARHVLRGDHQGGEVPLRAHQAIASRRNPKSFCGSRLATREASEWRR